VGSGFQPLEIRVKSSWFGLAIMATLIIPTGVVVGQGVDTATAGSQRSMVTRAELQAALDEIQRGLSSTAYSQSLRSAKEAEAAVIKDRLVEGDLRSGDEIKVDILQEPGLTAIYTVTPARTIVLPGNFEIPLRGVLRSEIQAYLTTQLKKYVSEPSVTATASVRVSIFGGVGHPGFYNVPANMLLSAVLQVTGGGPANNFEPKKSRIIRDNKVIIEGREFNDALYRGLTLDQLNVQAGDVIDVAVKPPSGLFFRILGAASAMAGVIYLIRILTN
jgi:protein involved in polysaccharide export with SLBB domain